MQRLTRREVFGATVLGSMLGSCASGVKVSRAVRQMGERVQVGPVIYTVLEADWHNDLGIGSKVRIPQGKFCVLRLTMTNAGNKEATVPLLHLEDEQHGSFLELTDGQGVEEWMGILRTLNPAETQQGRIVFDVRPGTYSLRVTDGAEPDRERTELVAIQFKIKESGPMTAPTGDK
jgi:hypothetical protein